MTEWREWEDSFGFYPSGSGEPWKEHEVSESISDAGQTSEKVSQQNPVSTHRELESYSIQTPVTVHRKGDVEQGSSGAWGLGWNLGSDACTPWGFGNGA